MVVESLGAEDLRAFGLDKYEIQHACISGGITMIKAFIRATA